MSLSWILASIPLVCPLMLHSILTLDLVACKPLTYAGQLEQDS